MPTLHSLLALALQGAAASNESTLLPDPAAGPPMSAGQQLVVIALSSFCVCYMVQSIWAFRQAARLHVRKHAPHDGVGEHSVLRAVFSRTGSQSTWIFIVITFMLSIGITIVQQVSQLSHENTTPLAVMGSQILYSLSLQNLLVLITLEVSYLYEALSAKLENWPGLMIAALVIDLLCYLVLVGAGTPGSGDGASTLAPGAVTISFMIIVFVCSFVGSASVILFSREDMRSRLPAQPLARQLALVS